uniref:Tbc1 domain family member 20-like isoform x1 n=1 Tax=Tetraselmis sp. GSL018 TaxID=582737 RepID=A0A061RHK5_9CHLO|mmetsp:Transcript_20625/g.49093  ORF Transcript_20625/g.49093 Transcript_20625/m.49093 type:complete len:430 (+) Transcript_20625:305-1594(+)
MPGKRKQRRRRARRKRKLGPGAESSTTVHPEVVTDISFEEQENARFIQSLLALEKVTVDELRREVAARGLATTEIRRKVWPRLLGISSTGDSAMCLQSESKRERHRDSAVVEADVQRSLWHLTEGWGDAERGECRAALKRLLNTVICAHEGTYYYQGLHDIASVLLLTLGEELSLAALGKLTRTHLFDFTRPTLEPVKDILSLLYPLLRMHDRELHAFLLGCEDRHNVEMGLYGPRAGRRERQRLRQPPYFAIAWVITWFSHGAEALPAACRLFDLFLSAHPLMPIYAAAACLGLGREAILACDGSDFPALHGALRGLDAAAARSPEEVARAALQLFERHPPSVVRRAALAQGAELRSAASVWAPDDAHLTDPEDSTAARTLSPADWLAVIGGALRSEALPRLRSTAAVASVLGFTALSLYTAYTAHRR